jgi:hypothetical protein
MASRNDKGKGGKNGASARGPRPGFVRCRVEPGMFQGEYLVSFAAVGPQGPLELRLLADEQDVRLLSAAPERGHPAEALLRVEVLGVHKGIAHLALPQPAQPVGERAYVEGSLLQEAT